MTTLLPNAGLLLYSFVRKEAVLSSQIEGTQSSLADLLLFEIDEQPGVPVEDAQEVSRYLAALGKALALLRAGLPICTRLLCAAHAELMSHPGVRGKAPGELPGADTMAAQVQPGGPDGRVFAAYHNYRVVMRWNRSHYFATAVGLFSDRLASRSQ